MTYPNRRLRALILLAALACLSAGCGKSAVPIVDSQPFEASVARYLDQNNMGVALKDIKAGPTIEGRTATLTASLHHATMGGPAVTWTFRFEQDAEPAPAAATDRPTAIIPVCEQTRQRRCKKLVAPLT